MSDIDLFLVRVKYALSSLTTEEQRRIVDFVEYYVIDREVRNEPGSAITEISIREEKRIN